MKDKDSISAWEVLEFIIGFASIAFWVFAFKMMSIRENGTHEQRVKAFGEDAAVRMEAENEKRKRKCKCD